MGVYQKYRLKNKGNWDGWFESEEGDLLLWVPREFKNGLQDTSTMCLPRGATGHYPVSLDLSHAFFGSDWTKIREPSN